MVRKRAIPVVKGLRVISNTAYPEIGFFTKSILMPYDRPTAKPFVSYETNKIIIINYSKDYLLLTTIIVNIMIIRILKIIIIKISKENWLFFCCHSTAFSSDFLNVTLALSNSRDFQTRVLTLTRIRFYVY